MAKRYYITTPIYYVNSVPHIGTALTTLASDVTARFQRMRGSEVHFLTGTDENAIKVAEAAQAAGKSPQEFVDEVSEEFRRIWGGMNISFDDFIRTTEERHTRVAQEVFKRLQDAGHIYLGDYEGWYDVTAETFYKESELVDGKSPDGNEVRWVKESNYFFRLSAFEERLLKHIEENPDFIIPEVRKNEVVSFIKQGLHDACVTRTNAGWGIPVPGDDSKVIYVWFEALINYISAIGWPDDGYKEYWPADVQWMGKDILVRFHATLWPAMLMGLGVELPKTLVGHGWMLMGKEKISKSKGNVVAPLELAHDLARRSGCAEDVAVDAVRYYMAASMPYEGDETFTSDNFDLMYDVELVNDLSNGIHRVISMLNSFCDGRIPRGTVPASDVLDVRDHIRDVAKAYSNFRLEIASQFVIGVAGLLNQAIDREKPWDLRKNDDPRLADAMYTLAWYVRVLEGLVRPIAPTLADRICGLLRLPETRRWDTIGAENAIPANHRVAKAEAIYPRLGQKKAKEKKQMEQTKVEENVISFEEFTKVKLRIARVLNAERVPNTDKLFRLELVMGEEKRQVVAGIAQEYSAEDLIGRQLVYVSNLQPRKVRGVESQGMILAADGPNGEAILIQPDREAPDGTSVH